MVFYFGIARERNNSNLPLKLNQSIKIMKNSSIRPLSFVLPATDGQDTFCSVFNPANFTYSHRWVEQYLGSYISPPTKAVKFEVCQINHPTGFKFSEIFDGAGVVLEEFSFTPAQACALALCSRREFGEKNFLLLVEAGGGLFTVYTHPSNNEIGGYASEFSDDEERYYQKELRIILPKRKCVIPRSS